MDKFDMLVSAFLKARTQGEMDNLLKGILTPRELEEITNRLQIVKMLKKGVSQQKIAEKLKVGVATVTRGSREIKLGRFKNI